MKNLIYIFGVLTILLIVSGCDEIKDGNYLKPQQSSGNDDTNKVVQKVLLEDYTGFKCGNCPSAAKEALRIEALNPGRVVVLAIHSGFFAEPNTDHTYDFRTNEGKALDQFFRISRKGNPNGMINRTGYPDDYIIDPNDWALKVAAELAKEPTLSIEIVPGYDDINKEISADIKIKYLKAGSKNHTLAVYMVEDSVIQYQLDYDSDPSDIEDYVHMHVLRGSFSGVWGETLSDTEIAEGSEFEKSYTYKIPAEHLPGGMYPWRPEMMKIVAFVHDYNDSFEVIQTEGVHLIEE